MRINYEAVMVFIAATFCIISISFSLWWYARRNSITFKEAAIFFWDEMFVKGFPEWVSCTKEFLKDFLPFLARIINRVLDIFKPAPLKHIYTPELYYSLLEVVKGYTYAPFLPVIDVNYKVPSYLYVSFYAKEAISEETATEIVWHIQAKYKEYLIYYGLAFEFTPIHYVQDNFFELYFFYAENKAEHVAYRERCRLAMMMSMPPEFRPMYEADAPQSGGLVLGYSLDKWEKAGQAAPFVWDMAKAPHMLVAGPTGGGKTVFVKLLLERLLKEGAVITVCDFKSYGDFRGLVPEYAEGEGCDGALKSFCEEFEQVRKSGMAPAQKKVLIFDEFMGFSASKSTKEREQLMRQISNVIAMGRAYYYHIVLLGQRFDSEILRTALRDQFGIRVHMGTSISQEGARMLFPGSEIDKSDRLPPCCGYISTPTIDLERLILPVVDIAALDRRLKALSKKNK